MLKDGLSLAGLTLMSFLIILTAWSPQAARAATDARPRALVADMHGLSYWEQLTFTSLEGIANRDRGQVFLIFTDLDRQWLKWYEKAYHLRKREVENPYTLLTAGHWPIKGYVVVDRRVPQTANLAATLAGTDDLLPVTSGMLADGRLPKLPVKMDLRGRFEGENQVEVYRWAMEHLWPRANHRIVSDLLTPDPATDISRYAASRNTLYLRFAAKKNAHHGARLRNLKIVRDGAAVLDLTPGEGGEPQRVVKDHGSKLYDANRFVKKGDSWVYKLTGVRGAKTMIVDVGGNARLSLGPSPEGPFRQVASPDWNGLLMSNRGRDYVVAKRGFFFGLPGHGHRQEADALQNRLYDQMPPLGRVLGWHGGGGEGRHVTKASRHGLIVLCSTYQGNYSFHQHIKVNRPFRQPQKPAPDQVRVDADKVYLSFVVSDGDSINFITRNYGGNWDKKTRGKMPLGWEIQPLLNEMAPGIVDYYYQHATPKDTFMLSASGIGYSYPGQMPVKNLHMLLEATRPYFKTFDASSLYLLPHREPGRPGVSDNVARAYADILSPAGLRGVIVGYAQTNGKKRVLPGPVAWLPVDLPDPRHGKRKAMSFKVETIVSDIRKLAREHSERPLFIPIHVTNGRMQIDDMKQVVDKLGSNQYKVVGPDELLTAYAKSRG